MPSDSPTLASQWLGQLLLSHRIDRLTPYVAVSAVRTDARDTSTGLEGIPGLEALDAAAKAAIDGGTVNQRAWSAGLRFDVRPGLALKFQVDRVHASESPVVTDIDDPSNRRRRLTLFSFALDFAY